MDARSRSVSLIISYLLLFLSFTVASCGELPKPKNVEVAVTAKWEGTPLLLEAGELIARDWKELFWDFVDGWLKFVESQKTDAPTAKECLRIIVKHGRSFLNEPLASLYESSLALRSASPRLVMYRKLADEALSSFPLSDEDHDSSTFEPSVDGSNIKSPGGHCCWVDTGVSLFFEAAKLSGWLQQNDGSSADMFQQPEVFDFDHVYPFWNKENPTAVLYGTYGTECFRELHTFLVQAAKEGRVRYVLRPLLPSGCEDKAGVCSALGSGGKIFLGGYGVELALKNMEYKAMDDGAVRKGIMLEDPQTEDLSQEVRGFIFSKILERKPDLKSEIMAFRDYLLSSTISDTLDVWELKDLGHQTAQRIVHASDPLLSMLEINQNFPSIVSSLSRTKIDNAIKDEIMSNQRKFPGGKSLMALNGALVNIDDIDLYMLIDQVQQELVLANEFINLKVPRNIIRTILSTLPSTESNMLRVDYRSDHVHYINNIEEDALYKRWRSNINEILMPVFPGQLRYIRKNLFHAVYVVDPATRCGLDSIDGMITLYENNYPMRFGLLFYSSKVIKDIEFGDGASSAINKETLAYLDVSTLIMRLFCYTEENYGIQLGLQLLKNLSKLRFSSTYVNTEILEIHQVEEAFVETLLPKAKSLPQDILLKLEKEKEFLESSVDSSIFVFNLGMSKLKCSLMLNGIVVDSSEEALTNAMNDELPRIQEGVYYGQINSRTDVLDKFLSESSVKRYNPEITADVKDRKMFLSLASMVIDGGPIFKDMRYLHSPKSSDAVKPVSHILTVNITSANGLKLIVEGIRFLIDGSETSRIGVLFVTDPHIDSLSLQFINLFEAVSSLNSDKPNVLPFLENVCLIFEKMRASMTQDMTKSLIEKAKELAAENEFLFGDLESNLKSSAVDEKQKISDQLSKYLRINLPASAINTVITNGRVIPVEGSFLKNDFQLLEAIEFRKRVKQIAETFEDVDWQGLDADAVTSDFISDVIMYVSSSMSKRDRSSEGARFELLDAEHSAVIMNNENSTVHIDAIIDPLSSSGQKLAPILLFLRKYVNPSMRILLNPLSSLADLPLKNYYRFVLSSMDDFNGAKAFFANMPLSKTLTMNLDVPEPWLIEPIIAVHDLDNILLENLVDTRTLKAVFELEALVLTGHCSEKNHDYPRGLQLILGTKSTPHIVDTLVMANLGYWQMKVLPGVFYLQLAPGRSSKLYLLEEDSETSRMLPLSKRIIIDDLRGKVVRFNVLKKSGMENERLLIESDNNVQTKGTNDGWNSNLIKWASGFIPGGKQSTQTTKEKGSVSRGRKGKTINIFSIASGHLYERFTKIMILSVLKNTKRPVKFWFIKNYLSPQFKDVIPHMAHEYDFEFELITYKWPSWLHKQTEKQRIIWAYKILFLDVIFPLSLERVIFVDADQVVRADMGELYDMDIKGRPLAYTPFCDNNKDMDGYRFWRQGFWRDHLRGRPYHISALYVVDLRKFRETAAGDHLRIFYENLSKDPNSLSNLDQDLPNYAQHQVPIFSLPQEWLWCESWCGNATKSKAKTIDLCNNPMTKEPKLQGAKRIVSEWADLDFEARKFTAKLLGDDLDQFKQPSPDSLLVDDLESKSEL